MARNIGLNENLYRQMIQPSRAESEYLSYKSVVGPLQKKLLWPSIIATTLADPMYVRPLMEKFGPKGLAAAVEKSGVLGTISGLGTLVPRALSEGYKSRRLAYERNYAAQLGAVGSASRLLDNLSSLRNLITLPGYLAHTAGLGSNILKHTPRTEHLLTRTGFNVIRSGKAGVVNAQGEMIYPGGILSSAYSGIKGGINYLTGGKISSALTAGAKKGGVAGALSSGVGALDKGISGLLASPTGVMFGLMAAQIGLSIYKSIKLAKLQPNRQPPDKWARRFYNPTQSQTAVNKILAMATGGKIDPQTLSFMIQQVQLAELQRLNMQIAGFRGEYHSEKDFARQEREKGTDRTFDAYGTEILGEDNRSAISKGLDWLEKTIHTTKAKYDPIAQLVNFGVGLLGGKLILPKHETSRIAEAYGYTSEKKMIKERAAQFGINVDQSRLLHTTSKAIINMAPTYEGKMLAILSASYDIQRMIASEAMTVRTGMGFDTNVMYYDDRKSFLGRLSSSMLNAITNIPGLNAIGNLAMGAGRFIFKTLPSLPEKFRSIFGKGARGLRDFLFGEEYTKLRDVTELQKASGLYKSPDEISKDFIGRGLPEGISDIRHVLWMQLETQEHLVDIQRKSLEILGGQDTYKDQFATQGKRLVWDVNEARWVNVKGAALLEEGKKVAGRVTKEAAYRKGLLGKFAFVRDLLNAPLSEVLNPDSELYSLSSSLRRMERSEASIARKEIALTGAPETYSTERLVNQMVYPLNTLMSREGLMQTSMAEEEERRKLERQPTSIPWKLGRMGAGIGMLGIPLLAMLVGGGLATGGLGLLGGVAAGGLYGLIRLLKERKIIGAREEQIETRTEQERILEQIEDFTGMPVSQQLEMYSVQRRERKEKGPQLTGIRSGINRVLNVHDLSPDSVEMWKLEYLEDMSYKLQSIQSYLGDTHGSVYELLSPGPRIAEVTVVDKDGNPIFFSDEPLTPKGSQQLAVLYQIRDYLGGKSSSIADLLDPSKPNIAQVEVLNAAAKGGFIDKNKPMLVGEEGPEILIPKSSGVIIPNKFVKGGVFKDGIFGKIYQTLENILRVDESSLKLSIDQIKAQEKDARELTMIEKLTALKDRMKEKAQEIWQSKVLELLGKKSKDEEVKSDKISKDGGIWDFIKNNIGKILGGLSVASLLAFLSGKIDFPKLLTDVAGFVNEQLKEMSSFGRIGVFAAAGAGIGLIAGGPVGLFTGALIGGAVGGVVDSIYDMIAGYQEGGILSGIYSFLTGAKPGEEINIPGNAGKWAIIGAAVGLAASAGNPMGFLIGALIGGAFGALVGLLPRMFDGIFKIFDKVKNAIFGDGIFKIFDKVKNAIFGESSENKIGQEINPNLYRKMLTDYNDAYQKGDLETAEKAVTEYYSKTGQERPTTGPGSKSEMRKVFAAKKAQPTIPTGSISEKTTPAPTSKIVDIPSPSGSVADILKEASAATGAPLDIMQRMAYAESTFNPNAKAPSPSTASGLFQFIKDTWKKMLGRHGKKYGLSTDESPFNARANALMGGEYIQDNIKDIRSSVLSPPPNAADIYAAHFLGSGGAKQLFREIKNDPNTIAAKVFPKQAALNEKLFYKNGDKSRPRTVKELYEVFAQKMAVDPGPALAKAGTGLTVTEKAESFGYKAVEKGKDILGILTDFGSKIKDAFWDALTKKFTNEGLQKKLTGLETSPLVGKGIDQVINPEVQKKKEDTISYFHQGIRNPSKIVESIKSQQAEQQQLLTESVKSIEEAKIKNNENIERMKAIRGASLANKVSLGGVEKKSIPISESVSQIGTQISSSVDKLIENIFSHSILNELTQKYPTSNVVTL